MSRNQIPEVVRWLEHLQRGADDIKRRGHRAARGRMRESRMNRRARIIAARRAMVIEFERQAGR